MRGTAYLLLGGAILAEIIGTLALRQSVGFTRLVPSIVTVIGYVTAFVALSAVLRHGMPVAVAYAVWSAVGIAAVSLISHFFLDERLNTIQITGLVILVLGVVVVEAGSLHLGDRH